MFYDQVTDDLDDCVRRIRRARASRASISIAFHGNVVSLWEALAAVAETSNEVLVDLGSDQTSLHNPFGGGYYPVGMSMEDAK